MYEISQSITRTNDETWYELKVQTTNKDEFEYIKSIANSLVDEYYRLEDDLK